MRISELGSARLPLNGRELLPLVQDGQTRGATLEELRGGPLLSIRDFGALGDGAADDTSAFVAMHAHLRLCQDRDPGFRAVILFPPGRYRYRWNRWLWGLRDVAVFGYGATLECINKHERNFECFPLVTNRNGFQSVAADDQESSPHEQFAGDLIHSAGVGAAVVALKDPAAAARFQPGRIALILSYDQQLNGYPPNCRYFDYVKIVDASGGRLTLDRPLRHDHRDDYPERGDATVGRARILDIDRDDGRAANRQIISGVKFLPNKNLNDAAAQYILAQGVMNFIMRDCELPSFVAAAGGDFSLEACAIEFCEPDKLVNSLTISNCDIGTFTQATGVENLSVKETRLGKPANVQARHAAFERCTFSGAATAGDNKSGIDLRGFAPTRLLSIRECLFLGKGGEDDAAIGPIGWRTSDPPSVLFDDPIRLDADGALVLPIDSAQAVTLLRTLEPGGLIVVAQESGGHLYADGRAAVVRSIRGAGADVRIEATWSGRPELREILVAPRVHALSCAGNAFVGVEAKPPVILDQTFEPGVLRSERYAFQRRSDFDAEICFTPGRLRSATIEVLKPYTGGDPGAFLRIEQQYPKGGAMDIAVDLRAAGRYEFTNPAGSGALAPDPFVWSLRLSHATTQKGRNARPSGAHDQLAIYSLSIVTSNPFGLV